MMVTSLVLVLIIVIAGSIILFQFKPFELTTNKSSDTSLVQDKIVELSELATLKYEYSQVIVSRTNREVSLVGLSDIKFAEAIRLIEYSGYLKAGTDFSNIQLSYDDADDRMLVRVPKSKILDNVAETEKAKVEDVKGNIFSDYPTQTIFDEINAEKEKVEKKKVDQGFLEEADKAAEKLLTSFLNSNGYENVTVKFY
ncbi:MULTISPECIES: DUF4230 domain-containing protein [unclassified Exiguobacterium]|uniref:DUF4230 domain-containing protein n=1 Tax=unclassified Exiguobacterium TaxID=2644629 RepID=UPI001EF09BB9|nr:MULTISPECIES: DUF4230 domain-containing protein [unclassified Exiguobacterium]